MKRHVALLLALGGMCLVLAIYIFTREIDPYGYGAGRTLENLDKALRLFVMVAATGTGFFLGWFCSPEARMVRLIVGAVGCIVLVFAALGAQGLMGWGLTWIAAVIGFCGAAGYWIGRAVSLLGEVPTTFGSSRWADEAEMRRHKLLGSEGFLLGHVPTQGGGERIAYRGDRHLLTIAPTRSGKGTTAIIPNLLTYPGSVLVIDPKGENALITAEARAKAGQDVHIVDPWGIGTPEGMQPARFNPLDWLQPGDVDIAENAMLLADALVMPAGNAENPFWAEEAKALIQGLILEVVTSPEEAGNRHLGRVRDLLLLDGEDMPKLFQRMAASPHHVVASTGARSLQKEPKLLANVLASAQAQTHFLDSARIRENLSSSDFRFEDLKAKAVSIYLVLPADRLGTFSRWLRLLVQQAITANARNIAVQPTKPVLFLLDEMPALGRLTMIEQAYALMAGFGIQLWGIVQDCGQLESTYGKGWETFISNSGVVQYFGSRDRMTAGYFSALCGETTVWDFSSAVANAFARTSGSKDSSSTETTTSTDTRSARQRKLAYPDELMRLRGDEQLLLIDNLNPIRAQRAPWFRDPALRAAGRDLRGR